MRNFWQLLFSQDHCRMSVPSALAHSATSATLPVATFTRRLVSSARSSIRHFSLVPPLQVHWRMLAPSAVLPPLTSRHLPLLRLTIVYAVGVVAVSPEGPAMVAPRGTGVPKSGVPSAFQMNFWARVVRPLSHPSPAAALAW